jgi:hypothetical protein
MASTPSIGTTLRYPAPVQPMARDQAYVVRNHCFTEQKHPPGRRVATQHKEAEEGGKAMNCPVCKAPGLCVCSPSSQPPALSVVLYQVEREIADAEAKWPPFNSAHEGFAVLAEEVDELADAAGMEGICAGMVRLWEHVKTNQKRRDLPAMRAEAIQVAAMAVRFVRMMDAGRGRR